MDGPFVPHVAEKNRIVGPHHKREHAPPVGGGPPSLGQDNDIYMREGTVLQVPHDTGELYQVIVRFLILVPFPLTLSIHRYCHQENNPQQQPQMEPLFPEKHAQK